MSAGGAVGTRRRHLWLRVAGRVLLAFAALFLWGMTGNVGSPAARAALFACAVLCLLGVSRPLYGIGMIVASLLAMGMDPAHLDAPSAYNLAFVTLFAGGAMHLFHRRIPFLAWLGASLPFWAMSGAVPWFVAVALASTFIALFSGLVAPLLSRHVQNGEPPLPDLAAGPLVEVPEIRMESRRGAAGVRTLAGLSAVVALGGAAFGFAGHPEAGFLTAMVGGILAVTFAFCLWFVTRLGFRLDSTGVHARVLIGERSIPWNEVSGLSLRYFWMLSMGIRTVYCVVWSPTVEITFPINLPGAPDFMAWMERATGRKLPAPRYQPNF